MARTAGWDSVLVCARIIDWVDAPKYVKASIVLVDDPKLSMFTVLELDICGAPLSEVADSLHGLPETAVGGLGEP